MQTETLPMTNELKYATPSSLHWTKTWRQETAVARAKAFYNLSSEDKSLLGALRTDKMNIDTQVLSGFTQEEIVFLSG